MAWLDPSLEARLRKIETELEGLETGKVKVESLLPRAEPHLLALSESPLPPAVLTVSTNVGNITVDWDDTSIINFDRYIIQLSTDASFTTAVQEFERVQSSFVFNQGAADTKYWARVATKTSWGIQGVFSDSINTTTGQIITSDVTDNAITIPTVASTLGSITIEPGDTNKEVQTLTFTSVGSPILLWCSVMDHIVTASVDYTVSLRRDGSTLLSFALDTTESIDGRVRTWLFSESITAAAVIYTLNVTIDGAEPQNITVTDRYLQGLELKK